MKKKIRAFTITEMIVALAISAIVAAIAYYSFSTVQKMMGQKIKELEKIENLKELHFLFNFDFSNNHNWILEDNLILKTIDNEVSYTFDDQKIKRMFKGKEQVFSFNKVEFVPVNHPNEDILSEVKIILHEQKENNILRFKVNREAAFRINYKNRDDLDIAIE